MLNINFVPDDYIQTNESTRTNLLYIVLFVVVMAGLAGAFATIKIRQKALETKDKIINEKLIQAQATIKQFEQLQERRKEMMRTALTTAQLLEAVPRSVILASLTNNLPSSSSLSRLKLIQKEPPKAPAVRPAATSQYDQAKQQQMSTTQQPKPTIVDREKSLEMHITIEGYALSDLQVATYIKSLTNSPMFQSVCLVESKEHKIDKTTFRQFKLTAMLDKEMQLSEDDINRIREVAQQTASNF